jgi:hypothetical protein
MARIVPDTDDKLLVRCDNIAAPTTFLDDSTANPKDITASASQKAWRDTLQPSTRRMITKQHQQTQVRF